MPLDVTSPDDRSVVFISKATPGDDEFALWLAPRLEAEGYTVFADILALDAGDRWRDILTKTLQDKAIKMLLCCTDRTLAAAGVDEEIGIATDLAKELGDKNFIIPLRLESFKKKFGIGGLQYVDFARGWADGLDKLLVSLKRQKVPRKNTPSINPHWEAYKRKNAISIKNTPERLTSNWLRISQIPDVVRYFEPSGAMDRAIIENACERSIYPAEFQSHGFLHFGTAADINGEFENLGKFKMVHEFPLLTFLEFGAPTIGLSNKDAANKITSMLRSAFERHCIERGLLKYRYSKHDGFHSQTKIGQRIPWGRQGENRSSMLRNIAKGHVWQYGVTAIPAFWPFFHFKLKSRVLFAPPIGPDDNLRAGDPYDDNKKQHRLRRTICKGWRNKQWHGRMLAFLELLSGDSASISVPLSANVRFLIDSAPLLFTSPVSTVLPDQQQEDDEDLDESTLGRPDIEEDL